MAKTVFYATQAELLEVCTFLESLRDVQYTKVGDADGPQPVVYQHASDIPSFGVAHDGWVLREQGYYIINKSIPFVVDEIKSPNSQTRFFIGARLNPDAVVFIPGGRLGNTGIVQGITNPVSQSSFSTTLYKAIIKSMRRCFSQANEAFVGPEALRLYREGLRLAHSLHSPPESDFKITE